MTDMDQSSPQAPADFPLRIIGLGNADCGDDGLGPAMVQRMKAVIGTRAWIEEQAGETAALIESWRGAELVIVVDAIYSGAPPGTIHRFDARRQSLPIRAKPCSSHAQGLAVAIELARATSQLPPRLIVFGIELKNCEIGQSLSGEVEGSMGRLLELIEQEVWRARPKPINPLLDGQNGR